MGKRKAPVPAALHHELSEYTSLLRALRTTDTLDLASQLIKPVALPPPVSAPIPDSAVPKTQAKEKGKLKGKGKGKQQDNWTRWPLLPGEFAAPEFAFDDEVRALAAEALLIQREYDDADADAHLVLSEESSMDMDIDMMHDQDQPQSLEQDAAEEEEEEGRPDPDDLPAAELSALNLALSTYLTQILAALAAHVPRAEKSMQNRLKPLGWQSVLEIMAAAGCCDPDALEDIDRRMRAIYPVCNDEGPSPHTAASRANRTLGARSALSAIVTKFEDSIFDAPEPLKMRKSRTRVQYKSKKFVASEDEENDGFNDENEESVQ